MKKITMFLALCVLATQSFDLRSSSSEGVGSKVQHALTRTGRAVSQVVQDRIQDPLNGNKEDSAIFLISAELLKMWRSSVNLERIIKEQEDLPDACASGDIPALQRMFERGTKVNRRLCSQKTILHHAATTGNPDLVRFLIQRGANVHAIDYGGHTPLCFAVSTMCNTVAKPGHYAVIEELCTAGANVNVVSNFGWKPIDTALHVFGQSRLIELLHQFGADINGPSSYGRTPLMCAIELHEPEYVKLLIKLGADAQKANIHGTNSVHMNRQTLERSTSLGHTDLVQRQKEIQRALHSSRPNDDDML